MMQVHLAALATIPHYLYIRAQPKDNAQGNECKNEKVEVAAAVKIPPSRRFAVRGGTHRGTGGCPPRQSRALPQMV